jgi:hypothetical protein
MARSAAQAAASRANLAKARAARQASGVSASSRAKRRSVMEQSRAKRGIRRVIGQGGAAGGVRYGANVMSYPPKSLHAKLVRSSPARKVR